MKLITLKPTDAGWLLESDAIDNALLFSSGGSADSAAIRIAQGLAATGEATQVDVRSADGDLIRKFVIPSAPMA